MRKHPQSMCLSPFLVRSTDCIHTYLYIDVLYSTCIDLVSIRQPYHIRRNRGESRCGSCRVCLAPTTSQVVPFWSKQNTHKIPIEQDEQDEVGVIFNVIKHQGGKEGYHFQRWAQNGHFLLVESLLSTLVLSVSGYIRSCIDGTTNTKPASCSPTPP